MTSSARSIAAKIGRENRDALGASEREKSNGGRV
jgi:hypothetical protein